MAAGPLLVVPLLTAPAVAADAPAKLVISELYVVDGAVDPAYNQSFVELRNDSQTAVDLSGWKITYRSSTATTGGVACSLTGTVQPGGYAVVALGLVGGSGAALDSVMACGTIRPRGSFGHIYVAPSSVSSVVPGAADVDMLGWGSGSPHEGAAPVASFDSGEALIRETAAIDTDDNAADFRISTLPTPGYVLPTSTFERLHADPLTLQGGTEASRLAAASGYLFGVKADAPILTPYRLSDGTALPPIELDGLPGALAYDPVRKRVYANAGSLNVIDADPASASFGTVIARVDVGALAAGVAVTPDGSTVLVASYTDSPVLLAVDAGAIVADLDPAANAAAVIGGWTLAQDAGEVAIGSAGGSLLATVTGTSSLSIVDLGSLQAGVFAQPDAVVTVADQAMGVAIGDGKAYVVSRNGTSATAFRGTLTAVDLADSAHPTTSVRAGANSDAVLFDDGDVYVLNGHAEGSMSVFDPETLVERGAVRVASKPIAMTVAGDTVLVAHNGSASLTAVTRVRGTTPASSNDEQGGGTTGDHPTGSPAPASSAPSTTTTTTSTLPTTAIPTPAVKSPGAVKHKLAKLKSKVPVLTGRARVGFKIGVRTTGWGPKGVKLRYQWYADGRKIKGATKKTIRVTAALRHKKVWVVVTGRKSGYKTVARASFKSPRIRG